MGGLVTHAALDAPLANRHAQSYAFVGGERGPAVKGPLQERDLSPARSWKAHGFDLAGNGILTQWPARSPVCVHFFLTNQQGCDI
jgi:hypothetical protein